jgi:hypothetical protein
LGLTPFGEAERSVSLSDAATGTAVAICLAPERTGELARIRVTKRSGNVGNRPSGVDQPEIH